MAQDTVELVLVMWNSDEEEEEEEVSGLSHDLTTNPVADVWENCNALRDMDSPGVGGGDTLRVARIARTFLKVCPISTLCNKVGIIVLRSFLYILSIGSCFVFSRILY